MKLLITGANGLLGKCFINEITSKGWSFIRTGNNNLSDGAVKLDISDKNNVERVLAEQNCTHIINCAADRDPESCMNDPLRAYRINAVGVENLAKAANKLGITLCHISTDYVFDGKNPPYAEDAKVFPLNVYGRSKLAGELAARSADKHLVLRIPALFRADISDSRNIATKINQELSQGNTISFDNSASRFYTLADDVAHAAVILLEKETQGVVHLSAEERTTKAEFARIFARSMGYDESLVLNIDTPQPTVEKRPEDSSLNTEYYKTLSDYVFSGPTAAFANMQS